MSLNLLLTTTDRNLLLHVPTNIGFVWPQIPKRHLIFINSSTNPVSRHSSLTCQFCRSKRKKKANFSCTASEAAVARQPSIYFKITWGSPAKGKGIFKTLSSFKFLKCTWTKVSKKRDLLPFLESLEFLFRLKTGERLWTLKNSWHLLTSGNGKFSCSIQSWNEEGFAE